MYKKLFIIALTHTISLACHNIYGMEDNLQNTQEPFHYSMKIFNENGEIIQTQIANNYIWLHGFHILHKNGIKGDNITVAFLEQGVNPNHPQFKDDQIKMIDCSQYEKIIGEDKARHRHKREVNFSRLLCSRVPRSNEHGNHVMGVSLSQPRAYIQHPQQIHILREPNQTGENDDGDTLLQRTKRTKCEIEHPGGCIPNANALLYTYSGFYPMSFRNSNNVPLSMNLSIYSLDKFYKSGLLSVGNIEDDMEEFWDDSEPPLSKEEKEFMEKQPVDDSPLTALKEALKGPAFAINWSSTPYFLMDSKDYYKVPEPILNEIGYLANKYDKVLIFCANNHSECLEETKEAAFYSQILNHPILSQRVVIAVNVCPTEYNDEKSLGELTISSYSISFKLFPSSNWPGKSLQSLCLSAVGANIISGYEDDGFQRGSGTSESAPVITSLAALVKKKYPHMDGPKVIAHLKRTALPLGDQKYTGCGYVYAPSALGVSDNEEASEENY